MRSAQNVKSICAAFKTVIASENFKRRIDVFRLKKQTKAREFNVAQLLQYMHIQNKQKYQKNMKTNK